MESLIGADRLDRIIEADIQVDVNGREIVNDSIPKKKDEPFRGIGLPEFQRRFQEIIDFYLSIHPTKKNYYDDIMAHKDMVFAHSIPVFSTLLRPTKLDNNGSLKYEKTNENYNLIAHLVNECNKNKLKPDRQKKNKYELLYSIQTQFNIIYDELCKILAKKKGDIRSAIGGRYAFTSRCVIRQSVHLKPDQIALPYHCLCELLQQVIINILVRTYNFTYADAYKKWYKAQITFDKIVYDMTTSMGGIPAPLNYEGYPYSVCTSVNEQVCHGFPSKDVILKDGDIINVDCSTILNGYFSDSSRMYCIGNVSPEKKKLVEVTKECVELGLKEVKPWGFLGDMGQAVHDHAFANGYTVVREIGGHGVGLEFHEDPWVGYNTKRGTDMVMAPGMIFTIEPMVNMGKADIYVDDKNNWEVYTDDGLPSAQWEIMVLVTEDGHEVLSW